MKILKIMLTIFALTTISGCAINKCKDPIGRALPGTDTAVVSIFLDKDGVPANGIEKLELHPGQKVIYAGPNEFVIFFKNKKTPNKRIENRSVNGVVLIEIPSDIFESAEFVEEFRKNGFIRFDYGIRANGKELDPPMIITRRN